MAAVLRTLIVDDEPLVRRMLKRQLTRLECRVEQAADGREALACISGAVPDVVFTDIRMPVMDGLELLKVIRESYPQVIVVVITGARSLEVAAEALRLGAHNYLDKPFGFADIRRLIARYRPVVRRRMQRHECELLVRRRELHVELDTRIQLVPALAEFLVSDTEASLPESDRTGVLLGLMELIANGVEHGSLEIGAEAKAAALAEGGDALEQLHAARQAMPEYRDRKVVIACMADANQCEWLITDEGPGFDVEAVTHPLSSSGLLRPCGRGIFLSRLQFDELEYLGTGNQVRARKLLRADPTPRDE